MKQATIMIPPIVLLVTARHVHKLRNDAQSSASGTTAKSRKRKRWLRSLQKLPEWHAQALSLCGAMLAVYIATAVLRSGYEGRVQLMHAALALMAADRR